MAIVTVSDTFIDSHFHMNSDYLKSDNKLGNQSSKYHEIHGRSKTHTWKEFKICENVSQDARYIMPFEWAKNIGLKFEKQMLRITFLFYICSLLQSIYLWSGVISLWVRPLLRCCDINDQSYYYSGIFWWLLNCSSQFLLHFMF